MDCMDTRARVCECGVCVCVWAYTPEKKKRKKNNRTQTPEAGAFIKAGDCYFFQIIVGARDFN